MKHFNLIFSKVSYGIRTAVSDPSKLYRFIQKCWRQGLYKTLKKFFGNSFTEYENKFNLSSKSFTVLTTPHCQIIALQLKFLLEKVGFECRVTQNENELSSLSSESIPIILAPQMFSKLPNKFIAFQLEQKGSHWFNNEYISILKKATFVLEYSQENLSYLQQLGIPFEKLYYSPIYANSYSFPEAYEKTTNKEYDLVFYGALNDRRKKILSHLSAKYKVLILSELFGEDLYRQLNRAKLLINIHFYENAVLETTRLTEAKAVGIPVISESSISDSIDSEYSDFVTFAKLGDIEDLISKIDLMLYQQNKVAFDKVREKKGFSWFDFYFLRFLLAQELISFESFSDYFLTKFHHLNSNLCLSLPETYERQKSFVKQPFSSSFEIFPGLRHTLGWIGCCYSYKFIFYLSSYQKIKQLCICEDDVAFPSDINNKLTIVKNYLKANEGKWQVFSGLISDVPENLDVTEVCNYDGVKFVYVTKSVGLVFSIFSSDAQMQLKEWSLNLNVKENTIDRFMARRLNKFITCIPFLISQNNSLSSTIWGGKNEEIYGNYIESSFKKLSWKIEKFEIEKSRSNHDNYKL